jgi:hypothetical protein
VKERFPYNVGQEAEIYLEGRWIRGIIVAGYRFQDGIVTIQTEDGRRIWCGEDRTDLYRAVSAEQKREQEMVGHESGNDIGD